MSSAFIDDFTATHLRLLSMVRYIMPLVKTKAVPRIFGFAKHHGLNQLDTLKLFGEHYAKVQATPNGSDHANIRNFYIGAGKGFNAKNPLTVRPSVDTTAL